MLRTGWSTFLQNSRYRANLFIKLVRSINICGTPVAACTAATPRHKLSHTPQLKDYETEAKLVHDRGVTTHLKNFTRLSNCLPQNSSLNRGSSELSIVAKSRDMFDGVTHRVRMTRQCRCHRLRMHWRTVKHRVCLATGWSRRHWLTSRCAFVHLSKRCCATPIGKRPYVSPLTCTRCPVSESIGNDIGR